MELIQILSMSQLLAQAEGFGRQPCASGRARLGGGEPLQAGAGDSLQPRWPASLFNPRTLESRDASRLSKSSRSPSGAGYVPQTISVLSNFGCPTLDP